MGGHGVNTLALLREVAPVAAWQQAKGRVAELSDLAAPEAAHGRGVAELHHFQTLVHEYNALLADPT
eukprot:12896356-Prorocentrum_lima.AAC.1